MKADSTKVKFVIVVTPEGDGPPPDIRLRRLLKCSLRSFGLRCTDAKEYKDHPNPDAHHDPDRC